MRIVILTIKTPGNIYLVNRLGEEFKVVGKVILEEKQRTLYEKLDIWFKAAKRYGFYKAANKYFYMKLSNRNGDVKRRFKSFFSLNDEDLNYQLETETIKTYDINSDEVANFIASKSPDVIAVCGSKVLKTKIFKLAPRGTVNIHCGITPDYRGANPVEWAVLNQDFEKVGVTIHFVNQGVDTGDVIYQKKCPVEPGDSIASLYAKNIRNGAELMVRAIRDVKEGKVTATWQPSGVGKHYLSFEYGYFQNRRVNQILKSM